MWKADSLKKTLMLRSSVQFSCSVLSNSWPHELPHTRLPVYHQLPELARLMSIELVMPSNHLILCRPLLPCLQSFPSSGSFPMSQFFASGGHRIGVSASTSVLPMNTQDWFPFRMDLLDLLEVQGTLKSILQHHSSKASIVWHPAFFIFQLSTSIHELVGHKQFSSLLKNNLSLPF